MISGSHARRITSGVCVTVKSVGLPLPLHVIFE